MEVGCLQRNFPCTLVFGQFSMTPRAFDCRGNALKFVVLGNLLGSGQVIAFSFEISAL